MRSLNKMAEITLQAIFIVSLGMLCLIECGKGPWYVDI